MAKHILKADSKKTWTVDSSGDTWIVNKGVDLVPTKGTGIIDTAKQHDNHFQILGHIGAKNGNGLDLSAHDDTVLVAKSGTIEASKGVGIAFGSKAHGGTLENHGRIEADIGVAIFSHSNVTDTSTIDNFGKIIGTSFAIDIDFGDDAKVTNNHGALIQGGIISVVSPVSIINDGTIKGGVLPAISLGLEDDKLVNSGTIKGSVSMGDGDDTFTNKGGSVSDTINLGAGNDTYVVDTAALKLHEDDLPGTDLVKAAVGWTLGANFENLTLTGSKAIDGTGNDLANVITGNAKANTIMGIGGDDILKGGAGADHFDFTAGFGHDTITDFKHGTDHIDLSGYGGISSIEDLVIADGPDGVTVTVFAEIGDAITIKGVTADQVTTDDFIFAA